MHKQEHNKRPFGNPNQLPNLLPALWAHGGLFCADEFPLRPFMNSRQARAFYSTLMNVFVQSSLCAGRCSSGELLSRHDSFFFDDRD